MDFTKEESEKILEEIIIEICENYDNTNFQSSRLLSFQLGWLENTLKLILQGKITEDRLREYYEKV